MEIKLIGVVGAGQMGGGIAEVAVSSGFSVVMRDVTPEFVERGKKRVSSAPSAPSTPWLPTA